MTTNAITMKLSSYASIHNGKYWNAGIGESALSESNWGETSSKCKGGTKATGCTSNVFGGARQCYGFSFFIGYLLTGYKLTYKSVNSANDGDTLGPWTVHKTNLTALTLEPGDIVRTSEHSAVGWYLEDSVVKVADVWGGKNGGCQISFAYFASSGTKTTQESLLKKSVYVLKYNCSHIFGIWKDNGSSYHTHTCIKCGYTEKEMHYLYLDANKKCKRCGRTGPIDIPLTDSEVSSKEN